MPVESFPDCRSQQREMAAVVSPSTSERFLSKADPPAVFRAYLACLREPQHRDCFERMAGVDSRNGAQKKTRRPRRPRSPRKKPKRRVRKRPCVRRSLRAARAPAARLCGGERRRKRPVLGTAMRMPKAWAIGRGRAKSKRPTTNSPTTISHPNTAAANSFAG